MAEQPCGRLSVIPSAALRDVRLTPSLIRALTALACFGDKNGYCWPSQVTVGDMLGITQQGFSKAIKVLRQYGYVSVIPRFADDGSRLSNAYRIHLDYLLPQEHDRLPPTTNTVVDHTTSEVVGVTTPEVVGGTTSEVVVKTASERLQVKDTYSEHAKEVFNYWKARLGHPKSKWSPDKREKIVGRLKEGFTVDQLKLVTEACRNSPHHMGRNETGTIYDSIDLLFRNATKVEWFLEQASQHNLVVKGVKVDQTVEEARRRYDAGDIAGAREMLNSEQWLEMLGMESDV